MSNWWRWVRYTVPVGTLLMMTMTQQPQTKTTEQVLIIGAGAAGLAAARRLREAGIATTILEARDRIGGRMWTDSKMASHSVELGAEFVHGSSVLTWLWIKKYKLKTLKPNKDKNVYAALNGEVGRFDDLVPDDWEDDIWELAEEYSERETDDITLREMLDNEGLLTPHDSDLALLINNYYAQEFAADLHDLGAQSFIEASYEGDDSEDGDYRIVQGYSALAERLAKTLDIRLNTIIQQIDYDASGVIVTDTTGTQYRANQVIVTLPLGVLKSGKIDFQPALPSNKIQAINGIGAGKVNKLILEFKKPFWKKKMAILLTVLDSQIWWRPGWNAENESPILTALIGGESGEEYSQMTESEAIEAGLNDLEKIFLNKDVRDLFVGGRFINWGADPYAMMGYSYNPVGGVGLRDVLAEPVNNVLFFAGEATNKIRPATVHGALESGVRAAEEVLFAIKKK